jgi:hypothetical protein
MRASGLQQREHFALFRESVLLGFREDELAVAEDVEL